MTRFPSVGKLKGAGMTQYSETSFLLNPLIVLCNLFKNLKGESGLHSLRCTYSTPHNLSSVKGMKRNTIGICYGDFLRIFPIRTKLVPLKSKDLHSYLHL